MDVQGSDSIVRLELSLNWRFSHACINTLYAEIKEEVKNERRVSGETLRRGSSMINRKEDDKKPTEIPASITSFLMNDILFPGLMEPYMQQVNEKLEDPNLLEWVNEVLSHRIVGEDLNKLTLFLIALSYKTDDAQGVIFTGPPAIGKSHACMKGTDMRFPLCKV